MLEFDVHKMFHRKGHRTTVACKGIVELGSVTALYGRSGIGKSTVLRMIAGLEKADTGSIRFGDSVWYSHEKGIVLPAAARKTGFVFQDYNLFPNMTVERNMKYASPNGKLTAEIQQLLEQLNLQQLAQKYPAELSGGQRQRVAVIRALCQQPQLLLMDEPFSALDDDAIGELIHALAYIRKTTNMTILLVSHRKDVLFEMTDSVVHMTEEGSVQGSTEELKMRN